MLRILANDGIEASAVKLLTEKGFEIVTDHYEGNELHQKIQEFDCLVVRSATKVRKPVIDAAQGGKLKLVIRAGVGVDNIDVDYAQENGLEVRNTPNASSASVAELALAHMFALARHIHSANVTMRKGEWNKKHYQGIELAGKTLGLIGFGRIARILAQKATALGMTVIYNDMYSVNPMDGCTSVTFDELLAKSDFISLHVPFIPEIGAVLGEKEFAKMKDGVYIIQCARGGVVCEDALLKALDSGKVTAAALDVFEDEPTKNEAIYTHPKISMTPHIGASTDEAQERIGLGVIEQILDFFKA